MQSSSGISCTSLQSTSSESSPKSVEAAASSDRVLDCPHKSFTSRQCNKMAKAHAGNCCKQSDTSTSLPLCHINIDSFNHMVEASHNLKTSFTLSPTPNPNPSGVEHQDMELLEEGQGECNADHLTSVNGSPSLWDNSEDSHMFKRSWPKQSLAAGSRKDFEEEQEYFQQVLGSSSHGWTDEKHSSYLDSMEADFLRSAMFKGTLLQTEPSPDLDDSASSHQAKALNEFKVCQSGRWRPVYVQAPYIDVGTLKQLAVAVKNPWIKRFRASKRAYFSHP